jgi:hypothetical protein
MTTRAGRHAGRPPTIINCTALRLLRSPMHWLLDPGMCELRYRRRRTGRVIALPVLYAACGGQLVVLVGDAPDKQRWRNFRQPAPVEVRRAGRVHAGTGRIVPPDDPAYETAWNAYFERHHMPREPDDRLLLIEPAREAETAGTSTAGGVHEPPRDRQPGSGTSAHDGSPDRRTPTGSAFHPCSRFGRSAR